jgi:hypothetical protein
MRKYLFIILLFSFVFANSQDILIDSLRRSLLVAKEDTIKIELLKNLGYRYLDTKPDSSYILYKQGLALARQAKLTRWEAMMLAHASYALGHIPGKKDSALIYMQQAMTLSKQNDYYSEEGWCYGRLSELYFFNWRKPDSALVIAREGIEFTEKNTLPEDQLYINKVLVDYYLQSGKPDSALEVCFNGILISQKKKLPGIESEYVGGIYYTLRETYSTDTSHKFIEYARAWARRNKQKSMKVVFFGMKVIGI